MNQTVLNQLGQANHCLSVNTTNSLRWIVVNRENYKWLYQRECKPDKHNVIYKFLLWNCIKSHILCYSKWLVSLLYSHLIFDPYAVSSLITHPVREMWLWMTFSCIKKIKSSPQRTKTCHQWEYSQQSISDSLSNPTE